MSRRNERMLNVSNVSVHYDGAVVALENIDMRIAEGGSVALLGPNGAGKTTLLKAIAGMLPFEQGEITGGEIIFRNTAFVDGIPPCFPDSESRSSKTEGNASVT